MKINKYLYGWKLYVNYGQGWCYEIFEETRVGYLENRKAYTENCAYPQRWSRGRELNPKFRETTCAICGTQIIPAGTSNQIDGRRYNGLKELADEEWVVCPECFEQNPETAIFHYEEEV